eukprot:TRINITY_DN48298_c0_g1_i1.p1 TRINITY_DN48298_c0_g1~~TRINITY_DN48298_c0_g1_i1.p1  ORF type:complete len:478 (+),score=82.51 TRINITY_DN48298_c0_g1_i1:79-1512(+)
MGANSKQAYANWVLNEIPAVQSSRRRANSIADRHQRHQGPSVTAPTHRRQGWVEEEVSIRTQAACERTLVLPQPSAGCEEEQLHQQRQEQLGKMLAANGLQAISQNLQDSSDVDWLSPVFGLEIRQAICSLKAKESMELIRNTFAASPEDFGDNGWCEALSDGELPVESEQMHGRLHRVHMLQLLLFEASRGGRTLWNWLEEQTRESMEPWKWIVLLCLGAAALQQRAAELEKVMSGWSSYQLAEGFLSDLGRIEEAQGWCSQQLQHLRLREQGQQHSLLNVTSAFDPERAGKETAFGRRIGRPVHATSNLQGCALRKPTTRHTARHQHAAASQAEKTCMLLQDFLRASPVPEFRWDSRIESKLSPKMDHSSWMLRPQALHCTSAPPSIRKQVFEAGVRRRDAEHKADMAYVSPSERPKSGRAEALKPHCIGSRTVGFFPKGKVDGQSRLRQPVWSSRPQSARRVAISPSTGDKKSA